MEVKLKIQAENLLAVFITRVRLDIGKISKKTATGISKSMTTQQCGTTFKITLFTLCMCVSF